MSYTIVPYLHFAGQTSEALALYASAFGGTPEVLTFGAAGDTSKDPDWAYHGSLRTEHGQDIFAADALEAGQPARGATLAIVSTDLEEAKKQFAILSEGGTVTQEITPAPWGAQFGILSDRFGIEWYIEVNEQPAEA